MASFSLGLLGLLTILLVNIVIQSLERLKRIVQRDFQLLSDIEPFNIGQLVRGAGMVD